MFGSSPAERADTNKSSYLSEPGNVAVISPISGCSALYASINVLKLSVHCPSGSIMERSTEPAGRLFTSIVFSFAASVSSFETASEPASVLAASVVAVSEEPHPVIPVTAMAAAINNAATLLFFINCFPFRLLKLLKFK